jgi:hypothetical protein
LFALSLEFFNNLIFVKFGKILTKYDLLRLMPILLFVPTFAVPAVPDVCCLSGIHKLAILALNIRAVSGTHGRRQREADADDR